ncbi:hypothetical protein ABLE68_17010 [Nocardioides sp. CN2-186]|uniref:hypothetical protein n=1 Tax=Nocardioides tweenelious TaxID=3156607 RepID=UPI0032B501D8
MSAHTDEAAVGTSTTDLLALAGSVHTFESFGRAVVQSIIQASAQESIAGGAIPVTASVTPLVPSTFKAGEKAAGEGAASPRPCFEIALDLGGGWPTTIKVCP